MRIFVIENAPRKGDHPLDRLHLGLLQSVAMVEALAEGWCEPPARLGLHLSTLIHQILAVILQTGGLTASALYRLLCERGAFRTVSKSVFADLLRAMAAPERQLIEQSGAGILMIGAKGERITESHEFYAVFATSEEYRVIHKGRVLGVYPASTAVAPGQTLIFAGRRWRIMEVDAAAKAIVVTPNPSALPPKFDGSGAAIHDHIVDGMRRILLSEDLPPYLDEPARKLLGGARDAAKELHLAQNAIIPFGNGSLVLPWVGTKKLTTLALALNALEVEASPVFHAIEMPKADPDAAATLVRRLADEPAPDANAIAARATEPQIAKFDGFLPPELMKLVMVVEQLDVSSVPVTAGLIVGRNAASDLRS